MRTPEATAYYVDLRGDRHWVPDGGTYECLVAQGRPVYDNIPVLPGPAPAARERRLRTRRGRRRRAALRRDAYLLDGARKRGINSGPAYRCLEARGHGLSATSGAAGCSTWPTVGR